MYFCVFPTYFNQVSVVTVRFSVSEARYHLALLFHAPAIYRDRYTLGGRGSCAQSVPPFRIETFATPPPARTSGPALQMQSR